MSAPPRPSPPEAPPEAPPEVPEAPFDDVDYPENDGNPMSDNTLQFQWIVTLQGGLDDLFRDQPDVLVAGDLLWYPVRGDNRTRAAPDAMVIFGRPRGHRGSYRQWVEGNIAPQVVFEVLSPNNTPAEMSRKLEFYDTHGVEEYYIYDPDNVTLAGYVRNSQRELEPITRMDGFTSPRLRIRFDMSGEELVIHRPNGGRFLTYLEQSERATQEARKAKHEAQRFRRAAKKAERETERADLEARKAAEAERERDQQTARADQEAQRAEREAQKAAEAKRELAELREKLRAAGISLDTDTP